MKALKACLVVLLVYLAAIELIDGARRSGSSRSGGSRSGSSGGSRSQHSSGTASQGGWGGSSSSGIGSSGSRGSSSGIGSSGSRGSSSGSRSSNTARKNWGTGTGGSRATKVQTQGYQNNYGIRQGTQYKSNNYGYKNSKDNGYSYRSPGYGTNWGTSFGRGKHSIGKNRYSKKALGLGVAAGFVGGAAIGGVATYGVYHRYNKYRDLMYRNRYYNGYGHGYDGLYGPGYDNYYNNYYLLNKCFGNCPDWHSHCSYGFCECDFGYTRRWGRCSNDWGRSNYRRPQNINPFQTCVSHPDCWKIDMNLICNKNKTTDGMAGVCECRTDMKWNRGELECQLFLDVDCSKFTYDTEPDPVILELVNKTIERIEGSAENKNATFLYAGNETDAAVKNETEAIDPNSVLSKSLLQSITPEEATEDQITEAYCRDIDSLSFEFQRDELEENGGLGWGAILGIVIFVLLLFACCCLCAICCACKGVLDCCKPKGSRAPSPVAFSAVRDHEEMQAQPMNTQQGGFTQQPGYPAATQAYQDPNTQPAYAPIYPAINQ